MKNWSKPIVEEIETDKTQGTTGTGVDFGSYS